MRTLALASPGRVDDMPTPSDARPLLATDDLELLDDVLRLAAAAGVEPLVVTSASALRSRWSNHPLVVIGADIAHAVSQGYVPRRDGVVLVARDARNSPSAWQAAALLGADQVAMLPEAETWLIDRFATMGVRQHVPAPVVGFVGACGGAGASLLTAAVAIKGREDGQSVTAIDLDPLGAGLEVLLGEDESQGLSWVDLANTRGRLRGDVVRGSLPKIADVSVLGWGNVGSQVLASGSVGAAIDGLARSCQVVVVDLPRTFGESSAEALCRCELVVVVCPRTTTAAVSASRMISQGYLADQSAEVVTRGPGASAISGEDVAETLGLPLLCDVPADHGAARRIERGIAPLGRRGGLRTAADAVLRRTLAQREPRAMLPQRSGRDGR